MSNPQDIEQEIARFQAEIESVQAGILRWLKQNNGNPNHPEIDVIKRTPVADAMILGVEDALWIYMDAWNWLRPELENSEVWQCAVAGALAQFKAQE